ncbi:ARM repeat-containing protein [Basidiobolus meristosporus CBS 931.73]|uniref:ARM repeat-containing protein n=1 Tax=Basidiobolus meristosporus CBS 931.73 TaxID=1314790 RepID=A0A1Y1Z4M8_9FUNG|nr:ARM repeat-containing protein [Basidiobolus meristosporus CBS 931.73]|eukprot:ORY05221.1 ARM repeat-containing protein [Basidiobolus meristosporus CBS 931.73]
MSAARSGNTKPVLHGVKIKTRKRVQSAQAKFEPEIFRDNFLTVINSAKPGDLEDLSIKLDTAGKTLDYKKYAESVFEILITGNISVPGGNIDDETEPSPFSIFSVEDDRQTIKKYVDVFTKLMRRYKYLQRPFEDTLKNILQNINKWTPEQNNKLAVAIGIFVATQLINIGVLSVLLKDHLVKKGESLQFVTAVFKSYLVDHGVDSLGIMLRKADLESKLMEFFPPNKRDEDCFARHFEAEDMKELVDYHNRRQLSHRKDKFVEDIQELVQEGQPAKEASISLRQQLRDNGMEDTESVQIVWEGLMAGIDWNGREENFNEQFLKMIHQYSPLLEVYCNIPEDQPATKAQKTAAAKANLALLNRAQVYFYENAKLTKHFRQLLVVLYNNDVLSADAILYWHQNSAKTVFKKQLEPLIEKLQDSDDEESDEE